MRKNAIKVFLITLLLSLCCFSVFATNTSYFNLGVGVAVSGRSDSVTSVALDVTYAPFDFKLFNPFFRTWSSLSFNGKQQILFDGLGIGVSLEIGRFKWNPLQFTLSNPGPWSPKLTAGFVFWNDCLEDSVALYFEASPFRTLDKDYMFEWFSPFVLIGIGGSRQILWGVSFFRFTPMYHI